MSTRNRLINVFRESLELPETIDISNLNYQDTERWDSVGHLTLVAAIETEFDVMLETNQVIEMSSFSKALEILNALGIDVNA
ncbi:conserved hypothetical protein [Rhodospirillaceae bacterium LM-1]|nr:conserved hypothetical protein [Rhodospirillaceae bacterium LM-1]